MKFEDFSDDDLRRLVGEPGKRMAMAEALKLMADLHRNDSSQISSKEIRQSLAMVFNLLAGMLEASL